MRCFVTLLGILLFNPAIAADGVDIDTGNTGWILLSSLMALLVVPGIIIFHKISFLKEIIMIFFGIFLVWITCGYSLSFSTGSDFIGDLKFFLLNHVGQNSYGAYGIPHITFAIFQMMVMFAAITLLIPEITPHSNFKTWFLILTLWLLMVYAPITHWLWSPNGWLAMIGVLDFSGGLIIHTVIGFSSLAIFLDIGKREVCYIYNEERSPVAISLILIGFLAINSASAIVASGLAAYAFITTLIAAIISSMIWALIDLFQEKKLDYSNLVFGMLVGIATISSGAGFISITSAIVVSIISALLCRVVLRATNHSTFSIHGIGGLFGVFATGMLTDKKVNSYIMHEGILISGNDDLLISNMIGGLIIAGFAFFMTLLIVKIIALVLNIYNIEEKN